MYGTKRFYLTVFHLWLFPSNLLFASFQVNFIRTAHRGLKNEIEKQNIDNNIL